jgi:hypothetical protein
MAPVAGLFQHAPLKFRMAQLTIEKEFGILQTGNI